MARRKTQLFNLSFLDLLSGALGAIIFLFIITPKGGAPAAKVQQVAMYFDTTEMKIFGSLHDSLHNKQVGDTLFTILVDYKQLEKPEKEKPARLAVIKERIPKPTRSAQPKPAPKVEKKVPEKVVEKPKVEEKKPIPKKEEPKKENPTPSNATYKGSAPSVPCKVSFEINWPSSEDNVDLFICKGNSCVYGGKKKNKSIGQWDSGKSRNRLFGNDLRTNQEAVRQFDKIVPGEYKIYAQFKESKAKRNSVAIKGLIYTNGSGGEKGDTFFKTLKLSKERVLIGTVRLEANGNFKFIKK